MKQPMLFNTLPYRPQEGDDKQRLGAFARMFNRGLIQIARFQRDADAWAFKKQKSWIDTVLNQRRTWGTFCTYQIVQGDNELSAIYLADGLQRLTAIIKLLEDPEYYGYDQSFDEIMDSLDLYSVTCQHASVSNHFEALKMFQDVNMGTNLTPAEFNKGHIVLRLSYGDYLYETLPALVEQCDVRIAEIERNRKRLLKLRRGAFALFLQYMTKTTKQDFWKYASDKHVDGMALEEILANELESVTPSECEKMLNDFSRYLHVLTAQIEKEVAGFYGHGAALPITTFRALLHLGLYRKNNDWATDHYFATIRMIFESTEESGNRGQLLYIPDDKGPKESDNIRMQSLGKILHHARLHGIPMPITRKKKRGVKRGYHNGHKKPFSTNGEGDTLIQTGLENWSLGKKDVEDEPSDEDTPI